MSGPTIRLTGCSSYYSTRFAPRTRRAYAAGGSLPATSGLAVLGEVLRIA
jgi:hypothetical protein